jgi:Zn-dependent protease with chaperone function
MLWRAGFEGGRLANAFAMITLNRRGVLFFDSLLDQLPPEQITAILAHEVAHLEQFHRRRLLGIYITMTSLIVPADDGLWRGCPPRAGIRGVVLDRLRGRRVRRDVVTRAPDAGA